MTWSEEMVARAYAAQDDPMPDEVITQTKRLILDSIGCIAGAADSPTAKALLAALPDLGTSGAEVTLFGQPEKTSVLNALLYNGGLLRYLDLNDASLSDRIPKPGSHNTEFLPLILALAEKEGLTGRDVVRYLSHAFDVATSFTDGIGLRTLEERGLNMDLRAAYAVPIIVGEMTGMSQNDVVDAIGSALSRAGIVNILDSDTEENSMAKNLRFPLTAHMALLCCFLARAGVTGPATVFEGQAGFVESLLDGDFDKTPLTDDFRAGRVMEAVIKSFAACYAMHGHLTATIALVREHDLSLEDVEKVHVLATSRTTRHTGQEARRNPTTKETADHSTFYVQSIAIRDRAVGIPQYTTENINDPEIRAFMQNVSISANPEFDDKYPAAEVTLTLKDGRELNKVAIYPTGHSKNPITDEDIETKYFGMTTPQLGQERAEALRDMIWRLDEIEDLTPFFDLMRG